LVRTIVVEFEGVRLEADMLENDAPKTCSAFWNLLPLNGMAKHCTMSGECIFLVDDRIQVPEHENRTSSVSQGEIFMAPHECLVVYGRKCFLSYLGQPFPENRFAVARKPEQLDQFEKVARRTLDIGARPISFARVD
jgi:hypothetical protein